MLPNFDLAEITAGLDIKLLLEGGFKTYWGDQELPSGVIDLRGPTV